MKKCLLTFNNILSVLLLTALCSTAAAQQPVSAAVKHEVMAVLDEFISTFSARDASAHIATYHFPHYRLAKGVMSVTTTAQQGIEDHKKLFAALPDTGWHRSIWLQRSIALASDNKVHVDTRFRRLRADGSEIGSYDSLYILQKVDGRWGVKMRSSFLQ
ncbi:MAG: hypothetical protein ACI9WS_000887 [Paraglaciecola psychrophila]|jgi:hypothetical protein